MISGRARGPRAAPALEEWIGRLLTIGALVSVALIAVGVFLMLVSGISPLTPDWPDFALQGLVTQLASLQPEGYLWLGLAIAICTPTARVAAALVGYLRLGDRLMVAISLAILVVVALSVVLALEAGA